MAHRENRGEERNAKIWISWEGKELFRWKKKALSKVFQGLSFGEKIKNSGHKLQNKIHVT